eukprot:6209006-Pleurochrysis_carterae.AAC.1
MLRRQPRARISFWQGVSFGINSAGLDDDGDDPLGPVPCYFRGNGVENVRINSGIRFDTVDSTSSRGADGCCQLCYTTASCAKVSDAWESARIDPAHAATTGKSAMCTGSDLALDLMHEQLRESTCQRATVKNMQRVCKKVDETSSNENRSTKAANQQSATANHTCPETRAETRPHDQQQRTIVNAFDQSHNAAVNNALCVLFFGDNLPFPLVCPTPTRRPPNML